MADEAKRAERKLAALLLTELDIDVEPEKVRGFIRKNWSSIAPLARIVHAAPDYTKISGDQNYRNGQGRGLGTGY